MFSSFVSTLKSQTERLKESFNKSAIINPEQIQSLSTRLKANVVQTSSVLKNSVAQNIQGLLSTATSSGNNNYDDGDGGGGGPCRWSSGQINCDSRSSQQSFKNVKNRRFNRDETRVSRRDKQEASSQWPLLENSDNKTWVELVEIPTAKTHLLSDTNSNNNSDELVSTKSGETRANNNCLITDQNFDDFFSDEEDENVTQRFTRIFTGIGYRASKVNTNIRALYFYPNIFYGNFMIDGLNKCRTYTHEQTGNQEKIVQI